MTKQIAPKTLVPEIDKLVLRTLSVDDMVCITSFASFVAGTRYTLDQAETLTRAAFPDYFVYRGGSHVALHANTTFAGKSIAGERVLFIGER